MSRINRARLLCSNFALALIGQGKTDVQRWRKDENLCGWGDERTAKLARFVPHGSRVLEFGAGRMALELNLPAGCMYTPSDLVSRDARTFVCDLNARKLPDPPSHDVAVFSGVLEYVWDVPRVIRWLACRNKVIVASYAVDNRQSFKSRIARRSHGWVNDFTEEQFVSLFRAEGFNPAVRDSWTDQLLFSFDRRTAGTE